MSSGLRSWVKGQSGNPAGRPRLNRPTTEQTRALVRGLFDAEWFAATRQRMRDGKENPGIVQTLIKYAFGNPDAVSNETNVGIVVQSGLMAPMDANQEQRLAETGETFEVEKIASGGSR